MELVNEFARVSVQRDDSANGPRLMIRDQRTGMAVFLDPLELETIAWMRHENLRTFLDPAFRLGELSNGTMEPGDIAAAPSDD